MLILYRYLYSKVANDILLYTSVAIELYFDLYQYLFVLLCTYIYQAYLMFFVCLRVVMST